MSNKEKIIIASDDEVMTISQKLIKQNRVAYTALSDNTYRKKKSISELFADFEGEFVNEEVDWDEPVGDEVW